MFSFLWSESKKRAVEDEKQFYAIELEEFKRSVHRATDGMLFYEIRRYEELAFSIGLAEGDPEQMKASGGREWVEWLKKRFSVERQFVAREISERGLEGVGQNARRGGVDIGMHAWEVAKHYKMDHQIRQYWGF